MHVEDELTCGYKGDFKIIRDGDIVLALRGANMGNVARTELRLTTSEDCFACTPNIHIDRRFLFYFLLAHRELLIQQLDGEQPAAISCEKVLETLIPVPPFVEQREIVHEMEKIWIAMEE